MADDNNVQGQTQQSEIPIEVQQGMAASLHGFQNIQVPDEIGNEEGNNGQQGTEGGDQIKSEPTPTASFFDTFKEKYGYEKPEDVLTEFETLRALKDKPPTPAEIKFENEQSEKIFKALQSGKPEDIKSVAQYLAQQEKLNSLIGTEITKDNADEFIKLAMQIKYKAQDLSQEEINYKFKKQFAIPKEPVQDLTNESDEDFAERKAEWEQQVQDVQMNKIIEAKLAKPELAAAKSNLILPTIEQSVDEGYLQYKKALEGQPEVDRTRNEAYKAITSKALETKLNFNDEPNKIAFEYQYEPDAVSFAKTIEMATDFNKFADLFIKPDGKPDREGFAKALHFALNGEAMLMQAMNQAKNATLKANLPDNSNGGLTRHIQTNFEPSELQKQMSVALNGYQKV